MRGSAVVIGAGIAGLATARGLLGAGWSVRVLERSSGLPGTGTALGMWPEAMRALDRLGVGEQVRAASVEQRGARLLRPDGTEIAHLGPGRTARLVPRPALLAALAQGLPPDVIQFIPGPIPMMITSSTTKVYVCEFHIPRVRLTVYVSNVMMNMLSNAVTMLATTSAGLLDPR